MCDWSLAAKEMQRLACLQVQGNSFSPSLFLFSSVQDSNKCKTGTGLYKYKTVEKGRWMKARKRTKVLGVWPCNLTLA